MEPLRPGQRIGAYKIIRQLGVGGMGRVYEAEHVALGVRRALKVFSTVSEHSEFLRKRFVAEGRILADLQHPRIVRVYDLVVDEDSDTAYFEMDLVLSPNGQPRTLADEQRDGVGEEKIAGWFRDICEGLAYIHSQGVVHRDISLDNVMIGSDGHAVITDFGVAKIIDDSYRRKINVAVTMVSKDGAEMRMGKGLYMAPELKRPDGRASFATDAWAVGVLLFRMLSGSWYDVGTHLEDWLADFEYDWHPVIAQLCNVDQEKRLGEGGIAALPALLQRKPHPVSFWRRRKVIWGVAVFALAVAVLGAGFLIKRSYLSKDAARQRDDSARYILEFVDEEGTGEKDAIKRVEDQMPRGVLAIPAEMDGRCVKGIANGAFEGCYALTSVIVQDGVVNIGDDAFSGCSALTSVTIPSSVTNIGEKAFFDCTALTGVTIPDGVTSIGEEAFSGCSALTHVMIPSSVTSIGEGVFDFEGTALGTVYVSVGDADRVKKLLINSGCDEDDISGVTFKESTDAVP